MKNYVISKDTIPSEYEYLIQPNTKYEVVSEFEIKSKFITTSIHIQIKFEHYNKDIKTWIFPSDIFFSKKELRKIKINKIIIMSHL